MSFGYLAVEVRRVLRSTRFLIFSVAFPVLLFLLYVGIFANGDRAVVGVLMVNMTAFGALSAACSPVAASRWSVPSGGNGSCGSPRCPAPATSPPKASPQCCSPCPPWCWCH